MLPLPCMFKYPQMTEHTLNVEHDVIQKCCQSYKHFYLISFFFFIVNLQFDDVTGETKIHNAEEIA